MVLLLETVELCRAERTILLQNYHSHASDHSEGNAVPNIGRPLTDVSRVASSSMTSQCSAKTPFSRRTISTTIQFAGRPRPVMRPCSISRFPSAKIALFSYRIVSGTDLINPDR